MEQISSNLQDFQDSLIEMFFDEMTVSQYSNPDRVALRGNFLNDSSDILDHGSMAKYDASRDWTKTATAMVQWTPSAREEKMGTVVASAKAIQENGISSFFHSMKVNLELKLGIREASKLIHTPTVGRSLTH